MKSPLAFAALALLLISAQGADPVFAQAVSDTSEHSALPYSASSHPNGRLPPPEARPNGRLPPPEARPNGRMPPLYPNGWQPWSYQFKIHEITVQDEKTKAKLAAEHREEVAELKRIGQYEANKAWVEKKYAWKLRENAGLVERRILDAKATTSQLPAEQYRRLSTELNESRDLARRADYNQTINEMKQKHLDALDAAAANELKIKNDYLTKIKNLDYRNGFTAEQKAKKREELRLQFIKDTNAARAAAKTTDTRWKIIEKRVSTQLAASEEGQKRQDTAHQRYIEATLRGQASLDAVHQDTRQRLAELKNAGLAASDYKEKVKAIQKEDAEATHTIIVERLQRTKNYNEERREILKQTFLKSQEAKFKAQKELLKTQKLTDKEYRDAVDALSEQERTEKAAWLVEQEAIWGEANAKLEMQFAAEDARYEEQLNKILGKGPGIEGDEEAEERLKLVEAELERINNEFERKDEEKVQKIKTKIKATCGGSNCPAIGTKDVKDTEEYKAFYNQEYVDAVKRTNAILAGTRGRFRAEDYASLAKMRDNLMEEIRQASE